MRIRLLPATLSAAVLAAGVAAGAESRLAPVPKTEATSTHGPYEMGACGTCHERQDAGDPGPAPRASNDLCFECHDEFSGSARVKMESAFHPVAKANCTACHNPHNSRKKKLRI